MVDVYINQIATSVPSYDIHKKFTEYAPLLLKNERDRVLFRRMASRSQIEHRYSYLKPHSEDAKMDEEGFYRLPFPDTATRMRFYERHAFTLACNAIDQIDLDSRKDEITHLIVTTCTGFYAPGLDLQIVEHYGLNPSVERTIIGFMGCYAAMNALKAARHIVRSESGARVLIVNLELCTLHMQDTGNIEQVLSFLIFADGCAASIVSSDPVGLELQSFQAAIIPDTGKQITWHIGDAGFEMVLSGQVPPTIAAELPSLMKKVLDGRSADDIVHWAVHPGGRTILDAVEEGAHLPPNSLRVSRDILRRFGNMSSATVMFVLKEMIQEGATGSGCAMAFGPGLTVESMMFQTA